MNSRQIDDLYLTEKKRWNQLINSIPHRNDPRWEEAIGIRHSFEWLHIVSEQLRFGEELHKKWSGFHIGYKYSNFPLHINTRKTYCNSCSMPLEKGDGMVYKLYLMPEDYIQVSFCIRCDPQYDHCPICDYPMVDGKCIGKCHIHII